MTTARHLRTVGAPLRFGVAVRVSQVMGRSGEQFHSPATQEAAARRAVEAAGGVVDETVGVGGVFIDLDVSGGTAPSDRPGMGAALELVRAGRLDGVAVYDLSRWSRDTISGLRELQEIAGIGGQVLSAGETIDVGTPGGVFTTTVQLAAQQLRRDEAGKAWRATHQSRHDRGLPHGKVPLGYAASGGTVTVDPTLGPAIAGAFVDYAAGVRSQAQIARDLTELRGVLTRQGVVSRLLRNPFHTGLLRYNGNVKVGRHPALVSVETFERVQARLVDDRFAAPRLRAPVSPLAGMVFCHCGSVLYRRGRGVLRPDGKHDPRMRCPNPDCDGIGAPFVRDLEAAVLAKVLAMAKAEADRTPQALARRARSARAGIAAARLQAEEKATLKALGEAGVLRARGVFDDVAYEAAVTDLRAELVTVQRRLAEAEGQVRAAVPIEALASAAERLERHWQDMTPAEARASLLLFVASATLHRGTYRGEPIADRLTYEEM